MAGNVAAILARVVVVASLSQSLQAGARPARLPSIRSGQALTYATPLSLVWSSGILRTERGHHVLGEHVLRLMLFSAPGAKLKQCQFPNRRSLQGRYLGMIVFRRAINPIPVRQARDAACPFVKMPELQTSESAWHRSAPALSEVEGSVPAEHQLGSDCEKMEPPQRAPR